MEAPSLLAVVLRCTQADLGQGFPVKKESECGVNSEFLSFSIGRGPRCASPLGRPCESICYLGAVCAVSDAAWWFSAKLSANLNGYSLSDPLLESDVPASRDVAGASGWLASQDGLWFG